MRSGAWYQKGAMTAPLGGVVAFLIAAVSLIFLLVGIIPWLRRRDTLL